MSPYRTPAPPEERRVPFLERLSELLDAVACFWPVALVGVPLVLLGNCVRLEERAFDEKCARVCRQLELAVFESHGSFGPQRCACIGERRIVSFDNEWRRHETPLEPQR